MSDSSSATSTSIADPAEVLAFPTRSCSTPLEGPARSAVGNSTWKAAPLPGSLSTHRRPPCCKTMP